MLKVMDGNVEGFKVGSQEGLFEGRLEGSVDGFVVGSEEGILVGR
jgi:hypothetical protein